MKQGKASKTFAKRHSGHSKHALPTTQEMTLHTDIIRWSILKSDRLYSLQVKMEKLYPVSKNKTWSWLWLRSSASYCKIQAYIEESRENHQAFRCDLSQIPYDYTVEVTNRCKGLDMVDRAPEELRTEVCNVVQEVSPKSSQRKRNATRRSGWLRRPDK